MSNPSRGTRAVGAVAFSLIMGGLLAFAGLLLGWFLWGRFGPPPSDLDDTDAYLFGLLVGGAMGLIGCAALLWKFWPRTTHALDKVPDGTRLT
jgi:UDP-N-acetylmuramyl pentapeptide phosphotransferase/UDP-N-acetylglucosamine-1-phosphate transferase